WFARPARAACVMAARLSPAPDPDRSPAAFSPLASVFSAADSARARTARHVRLLLPAPAAFLHLRPGLDRGCGRALVSRRQGLGRLHRPAAGAGRRGADRRGLDLLVEAF